VSARERERERKKGRHRDERRKACLLDDTTAVCAPDGKMI